MARTITIEYELVEYEEEGENYSYTEYTVTLPAGSGRTFDRLKYALEFIEDYLRNN